MSHRFTMIVAAALTSASASASQDAMVKLDFGPAHGAVLDEFSEVTPDRSDDARASWQEAPRKGVSQAWLDPVGEDHVIGGTLKLDLPAGTYALGALFQESGWTYRPPVHKPSGLRTQAGEIVVQPAPLEDGDLYDPVLFGQLAPSFAEGSTPWERQIAPRLRWRTGLVEVGEEGLTVEAFGLDLSALVVAPVGLAELEVELALIDSRRRDAWLGENPPWPEPPLAASEGLQGLQDVAWDGLPTAGSAVKELSIERAMSPGERHSLLLAVHGSDTPAQVQVQGLDGLQVQVTEVIWQDLRLGRREIRPVPTVLRPMEQGELIGGQGVVPMLGLAVEVPEGTAAGRVQGTVTVRRGDEVSQLELTVRVRDLHLEEPPVPWGYWADLRGPVATAFGPNSDEAKANWKASVALARRSGADLISVRGAHFPELRPGPDHQEEMFERLAWAVQEWRDQGGEPAVQWVDLFLAIRLDARRNLQEPVFDDKASAFLKAALDKVEELGLSAYVIDEESLSDGLGPGSSYARKVEALRALNPRVALHAAEPHPIGWDVGRQVLDRVYTNPWPQIDPSHAEIIRGDRADAWGYNYGYHREATGLMPWLLRPDGLLIWHLNDAQGAVFNEFEARRKFHVMVPGPDPGTVWATRRLERLTHGSNDQRYLGTLAALVEELGDRRSKRVQAAVDHACLLLFTAQSGLSGHTFVQFLDEGLRDDTALDRLQAEVGDTAEVLSRWSRRQRDLARGQAQPQPGAFLPDRCVPPGRHVGVQSPHADPSGVPALHD